MFTVLVAASLDARSTFQSAEDSGVIVFRIKRSTVRVRGAIEPVYGRATHTVERKGHRVAATSDVAKVFWRLLR